MARTNRDRAFSSLHHVIDMEWMQEAYRQTRKDGAPGIDGVTAQAYEANLEVNLQDLLDRIRSGRYVAPPVRRARSRCCWSRSTSRTSYLARTDSGRVGLPM